MKFRTLIIAAIAAAVVLVGGYVAIKYIIPSIVTEVAVTGVPTARSNNLDVLKTSQAETRIARTATPQTRTLNASSADSSSGLMNAAYVELPEAGAAQQAAPLYESCIAAREATPTPEPTIVPAAEATPAAEAPAGDADYVFLTVVAEESEACFQVFEMLRGRPTTAVGVTKTIAGEIALDRANIANTQLGEEFNVNLAELKSDQGMRDRWVISSMGFNFNQFPFAKLTEAKAIGLPARPYQEGEVLQFQITGKLLIREAAVDVTFNAKASFKDGTLVANAYADYKLTDWGLQPPDLGFVKVEDPFRIVLNIVAREAQQ
jgi:polyisoprenoid-binding protein YceI